MLKFSITALFAVLFSVMSAGAVTFKVIGKNREILFSGANSDAKIPQTVGQVSVNFFLAHGIPFEGDIDGLVSINGLGSELEIISDTEMKAYGWCYSLNGTVPEDFVHKVNIIEQNTELVWFYAYAYYKAGDWTHQCVPHGEEKM